MRTILALAIAMALATTAGGAHADKAAKKANRALRGRIETVSGQASDGQVKIALKTNARKAAAAGTSAGPTTIVADSHTMVTVDGQAAKLADLKPGYSVIAKPATGTAQSIEAISPQAAKERRKAAKENQTPGAEPKKKSASAK